MNIEQFKNTSTYRNSCIDNEKEDQLNFYFRKLGIYVQVNIFMNYHKIYESEELYVFINGDRQKNLSGCVYFVYTFLIRKRDYDYNVKVANCILTDSYKLGS